MVYFDTIEAKSKISYVGITYDNTIENFLKELEEKDHFICFGYCPFTIDEYDEYDEDNEDDEDNTYYRDKDISNDRIYIKSGDIVSFSTFKPSAEQMQQAHVVLNNDDGTTLSILPFRPIEKELLSTNTLIFSRNDDGKIVIKEEVKNNDIPAELNEEMCSEVGDAIDEETTTLPLLLFLSVNTLLEEKHCDIPLEDTMDIFIDMIIALTYVNIVTDKYHGHTPKEVLYMMTSYVQDLIYTIKFEYTNEEVYKLIQNGQSNPEEFIKLVTSIEKSK